MLAIKYRLSFAFDPSRLRPLPAIFCASMTAQRRFDLSADGSGEGRRKRVSNLPTFAVFLTENVQLSGKL